MSPESEIARLFAAEFGASLARIPRPVVPAYKPLASRDEGKEYERQEMLDGRERYATGDHTP